MSAKHDMSDHQYQIYQKIHGYEDPLEEEQGKIGKENAGAQYYRRKGHEHLKHKLRVVARPEDADFWEDDAEEEALSARAERELRNARTHKRRLKGLSKHLAGD